MRMCVYRTSTLLLQSVRVVRIMLLLCIKWHRLCRRHFTPSLILIRIANTTMIHTLQYQKQIMMVIFYLPLSLYILIYYIHLYPQIEKILAQNLCQYFVYIIRIPFEQLNLNCNLWIRLVHMHHNLYRHSNHNILLFRHFVSNHNRNIDKNLYVYFRQFQ